MFNTTKMKEAIFGLNRSWYLIMQYLYEIEIKLKGN